MNEQESQEFTAWHEQRMVKLAYQLEIVAELREARIKFLAAERILRERRQ